MVSGGKKHQTELDRLKAAAEKAERETAQAQATAGQPPQPEPGSDAANLRAAAGYLEKELKDTEKSAK